MNKIPKSQTGSPSLLSPNAYYSIYHQRANLQDARKVDTKSVSSYDKFRRMIELYSEMSKILISDLKPQMIHEEEKMNSYVRKLESHLDNKIRVNREGKKYLTVNGKIRFDGNDDQFEEFFRSGKLPFSKIAKEIVSELISVIQDSAPTEPDKSVLLGDGSQKLSLPEPVTIAVDLDNTIVDREEQPLPGAKDALEILKKKGFRIAIYTARFSCVDQSEWQSMYAYVQQLLTNLEIPFDEISISKPVCKFYIDDRGIRFTNWTDVLSTLDMDESLSIGEEGPQGKNPKDKQTPGLGMMEEVQLEQEVIESPRSKSFSLLCQKN